MFFYKKIHHYADLSPLTQSVDIYDQTIIR